MTKVLQPISFGTIFYIHATGTGGPNPTSLSWGLLTFLATHLPDSLSLLDLSGHFCLKLQHSVICSSLCINRRVAGPIREAYQPTMANALISVAHSTQQVLPSLQLCQTLLTVKFVRYSIEEVI